MKTLDERGNACPLPVIHTMKECNEMNEGDNLLVHVDNETQVENLTRFATNNGHKVSSKKIGEKDFEVSIIIGNKIDTKNNNNCSCMSNNGDMVIAISSNQMGDGDERLGKNLMKAFIFSVTQQENLPSTILFYNSGAYLTTEGSDSLDDLKKLEDAGVSILTCGTCLEFYKLKEKLKVGKITNMYDIVGIQEMAMKVIRP